MGIWNGGRGLNEGGTSSKSHVPPSCQRLTDARTHTYNDETRGQVKQHKTAAMGIWVTYQGGVYDITEFAENHPGACDVGGCVGCVCVFNCG